MSYSRAIVIVDGEREQERIFTDYLLFDEFISEVRDDAASDGTDTKVHVFWHDEHEPSEECNDRCDSPVITEDRSPQYEFLFKP